MNAPAVRTYVCSACGQEFDEGWSDEDAVAEFAARHGRRPDPLTDDVVCDDCHKLIMTWVRTQQMTRHQLLEWLAKEDSSAYGECKGQLLDQLLDDGAVVITPDIRGDADYARVRLTEKGWHELRLDKELGGL